MCGIIGYIGKRKAVSVLMDGLQRLEYRGYDSAGVAVLNGGEVQIRKTEGKLARLVQLLKSDMPEGKVGVGHTRWATHGKPSDVNAHPHKAGVVTVVHNGIIENYVALKKQLERKGCRFESDTDTEVICHLVNSYIQSGSTVLGALKRALKKLKGSFAIVLMVSHEADKLYIAKHGSPLIIGCGEMENFVASDVPALLPYTRNVVFVEDGEYGVVTRHSVELYNEKGKLHNKPRRVIDWNPLLAEKGGYKHFMLKEIFEQPRVMEDVIIGRVHPSKRRIELPEAREILHKEGRFDRIVVVACGTSFHAGLVGRYVMESVVGLPVMVEYASEFRYRDMIIDDKTLVVAVSQSGETADTIASVKLAKEQGAKVLAICNVADSSIPRLSDATLYLNAGPEIGVASTKAFTAQVVVFLLLSFYMAQIYGVVTARFVEERIGDLLELPRLVSRVLRRAEVIKDVAVRYAHSPLFLYIARGVSFPVALEGALKLKEIAYVNAEGFAAGELKHGPIALIDNGVPVVAIIPRDRHYEKVLSNVEEVRARGADVIAVSTSSDRQIKKFADIVLPIPSTSWYVSPVLSVLPLQLLAYYVASHKGTDIDQPRNLAKSVTVE